MIINWHIAIASVIIVTAMVSFATVAVVSNLVVAKK
jgi:hypothetical protein